MRRTLTFIVATLALAAQAQVRIKSYTATRHEITATYDRNPDREAMRILAAYSPAVDSTMAPVLGHCRGGMTVERPESALSNWVSDTFRAYAQQFLGTEVDVAMCNMGGLRSMMPDGVVTQGDVFEIAPFDNRFTLIEMDGSTLLRLCENVASVRGEGISGMQLVITRDGQLVSAKVNGEDIVAERMYKIATIDYLAEGNDRMTAYREAAQHHDSQVLVREVLMQALRDAEARGETVSATTDGRIRIVDPNAAGHQAPPAPGVLRILHTNDTHSQVLPYNINSTNRELAGKGGYVRRSTFINQQRQQPGDILLLDAGDFSQGSLYYNLYQGEVEVTLMNHIGYDAGTIGNHEFDFGLENMARLFRMATFPIVSCNLDFTGTAVEGLVKPYVVIERAGLRIGVTGVTCQLEGLVQREKCVGVTYSDPREVLPAVVECLRNNEQCDVVVCLSHVGWGVEGVNDRALIEATRGIDVVIGGHSHTYMQLPEWVDNADGRPVIYYQMGKTGRFVGEIRLTF